jgi:chitinase
MKNDPTIRWAVVVATVLAGVSAVNARVLAAPGEKDTDKVFVGYLFGQTRNIDFRLYTHICHAFLVADGEGHIQKRWSVPSRQVTDDAHKAGVRVILSLGGWGWDKQFASIVSKPEAEERYAQSVMEIVDQFNYDGIDFDWEYPDTKEEVAGFERLTRRFRKELDELGQKKGRTMQVTMAASANPGTIRWLDKAFLLETMDWINVMTYDYTGDRSNYAGHHSPLHASSKQPGGNPRSTELTMKYFVEERGLPANRLAVGIPLYGRGFHVAAPYASTKGAPKSRVPGGNYSNIHKLQGEAGWVRKWDDETKNPWLVSTKEPLVIGYDDAESVGLKTEWAMRQGFRGVFFWQIHADRLPDGTHPLQEASHKAWEKTAPKGQ